ncbi:3'-5' exonuclease [Streptantibioticus parmotrematis]|uniref:3'-5' exonuclease n=1 Tax=Streptantibioticus parmotrematis TaxID=2873249 RepID=UPI0027DF7327|nr:3'-5' exonuclease [Streptantibioticus parmotrematis]
MLPGYAVVDVEATGSSSRRHRVVEVAVVQLDDERRVQGEYSTLIDPEGPVGPTHIHGIEQHHLLPAPRFGGIAARLAALLRGRVLVGHNVGCDRAFLAAEFDRAGIVMPDVPTVCTMRLAEESFGAPYGLSLRACARAAGISGWAAHTALGDARASGQLFARCAPQDRGELAEAAAVPWPASAHMTGEGARWIARRAGFSPFAAAGNGDERDRRMVSSGRHGGA